MDAGHPEPGIRAGVQNKLRTGRHRSLHTAKERQNSNKPGLKKEIQAL
jgi:hypothetical protein